MKVTETIFIFNFSLFSSDTDEEEMNRLAEAAVSGHSIIKNGKVTLHLATKKRLECALFSACLLSFVGALNLMLINRKVCITKCNKGFNALPRPLKGKLPFLAS